MVRLPRLPRKKPATRADSGPDAATVAPAQSIVQPLATMILADVALRTGQALVRKGVLGGLLGREAAKAAGRKGGSVIKGRSFGQTLIGTALARVATSSVPGAIVVGGGLLAKTLYDRKQARAAGADVEDAAKADPDA